MISKPKKDDEEAWLEFVSNPKTVHIAVVDADCPLIALKRAIELFPDELNQIAFNPEAPSELLEVAYLSPNVSNWHRRAIVEHNHVTLKILSQAIHHEDEEIRAAVATSTNDLAQIKKLSKEPSQHIRLNLAKNPSTPSKVLEVLIKPYARHIAALVLENPNCTDEIFKQISEMPFVDKDDSNISGYWVTDPLLAKAPKSMLAKLFERSPQSERHYVFKNPHATIEMIREVIVQNECIYDTNSMDVFLQRDDLPDDLILLALKKVRKDYVINFAYMPKVSQTIVNALLALKSKEIYLALISNRNIDGEMLMPLVKIKSNEVLMALAKRTYFSSYDKETGKGIELEYKKRESLWELVDSLINKNSRFEVSLVLYGQPYSQIFERADRLNDNDSEITIEVVKHLLYRNYDQVGVSVVIPNELLNEFKKSPLSDLLDFISEDDNEFGSNSVVFEESRLDGSGFEVLEYEVESGGDLDVYCCQWVQISFTLKASSVAETRNTCVSHIPKYLEIWQESVNSTVPIYKITGSAGRVGGKFEAIKEEWFLHESLA